MTATPALATRSVLEMFAATNPDLEVWWDASPLVLASWEASLLRHSTSDRPEELRSQLLRLWDPTHLDASLFRGATTNPLLALAAIRDDPDRWSAWIRAYRQSAPHATAKQVAWQLYKEIVRLGAEILKPLHVASGYRYGHLSALVDSRSSFDEEAMMAQALELSTLADNVMVELPASREGLRVLHELTRRGISTNCGLAATVSQFVTAAEQIQAGLLKARASGVNLTAWRSVVSHLYTRWAETEAFAEEASHAGTPLSVDERSWASIAVFKEAYRIFRHRAYPTKMLLRSARPGPDSGGVRGFWPLQQMAGADGVFTVHPPSVSRFIAYHSAPSFTLQIWSPIPEHVMSKLSPLQYFQTAYQPDRTPPEAYDEIPALLDTLEEFRRASSAIEGFVQGRSGPRVGGLSHDESSVADSEE